MSILLWTLQIALALHTLIGAVWKLSNAERTVPSLSAIPHSVWLALSGIEMLCTLGLVVALFSKPLAVLAPIAAILIAAEMLLFCGVHLRSGANDYGPMAYWLVVAIICAFLAYARLRLRSL